MKSEGLYSLTFTLRQAEHCNQGGLFKDNLKELLSQKRFFARQFIYILKRYIAVGEANGKSSTFTIKKTIGYTQIVWVPCGVIRLPTDVLRGSSGVPAPN